MANVGIDIFTKVVAMLGYPKTQEYHERDTTRPSSLDQTVTNTCTLSKYRISTVKVMAAIIEETRSLTVQFYGDHEIH